ncbi:MAG: type IV pilin-like G/H family protein [Leptolyngbyaceae cyanobacterium bins.349]|nr:type IV pilin-like G/H family protein [Leptolyngbyaceae cyanobacterium bins.349]
MTQSSLLELARNGHPQAIAALMNSVLEPKGVIAKTQLDGDCLHIVFTSEHLLSQAAIASFVKNGLTTLGTRSFQTVKLYAKKIGQDAPLWMDSFALGHAPVAPVQTVPPTPPPAPKPTAHLPQFSSVAPSTGPSTPVAPPTRQPQPPARSSTRSPSSASVAQKIRPVLARCQQISEDWVTIARRYKVAIAVGVGAFLIGGTAALLTNIQANSTSQASATRPTEALPAMTGQSLVPPTAPSPSTPEGQAETYLTQMNQAQQSFYQTHGRFANSLEELEQSAAILSQSAHYTYRLVLREQAQAVLTATPKQEGLKSYSGTVLITNAATGTDALQSIICKTHQPSNFPPILAQAAEPPILCPPEAVQVAN